MSFTTVTLQVGPYQDSQNVPQAGNVTLRLVHSINDGATTIEPVTHTVTLDSTGTGTVNLPATDDPTTQPTGVTYQVVENIVGLAPNAYLISLTHTQTSQKLAAIAPASISNPEYSYLTATQAAGTYQAVTVVLPSGDTTGATDTTALNSALGTVNRRVALVAGTYYVKPDVGLNLAAGVDFAGVGAGTVITIPNNYNVTGDLVRIQSVANTTVRDMCLDGNKANNGSVTNYGLYHGGATNPHVTNVITRNFTGVGNHVYNTTGARVHACESTSNGYHGFEAEQVVNCTFTNNRGHGNALHGFSLDPGEVGGTGSQGNTISGNVFDHNTQYGLLVGVSNAGTQWLSTDNTIAGNTLYANGQYGLCLYQQDGQVVTGNVVALNGYFGIYGYQASHNLISGNRLHNNSQATNNAYDEIYFEGNAAGHASADNIISGNHIVINGATKARYGLNFGTTNDGPNTIKGNRIPNAGASGSYNNVLYSWDNDLAVCGTSTGSPGAGGAGALPATPAGYAWVIVAGSNHLIPYY